MATAADELTQALHHHRAGDLEGAAQLYRRVVEADPSNADAWSYLGEASLGRGAFADAVLAFRRALAIAPGNAATLNNLGIAFAQQQKPEQATECFREAVRVQPDFTDAYNNLGIALSNQGKLAEAESCYRQALRLRPDFAEAYDNLGLVLGSLGRLTEGIRAHEQALAIRPDFAVAHANLQRALAVRQQLGHELTAFKLNHWHLSDDAVACNELGLAFKARERLTEAIACFQEAIRLRPDFPEAFNNLAITYQERGNTPEGLEALRRALALRPDYPEAQNNLGTLLEAAGDLDAAIDAYHEALRLRPGFAEAHHNLGIALQRLGRFDEALAQYQQARALRPDYAEAYHKIGNVLLDLARTDEAVAAYEQALRLRPDYPDARFGRAVAWLQAGDFARGFPEFEWRWRRKTFPPRPFPQPIWDGSALDGRTILLHAEQGFGDTLQFVRYFPLVKRRGGRVILECQDVLVPLLAACPGVDQVVEKGVPLPPFDTHAPLVSLPGILGTTLATIPADVPYLFTDAAARTRWREALGADPAFRVGIAWQGNPGHPNDRHRSVPLGRFERLARLPGVRLYSLQKGPGAGQLAALAGRFPVVDLGTRFETFMDTAAAIQALDLVITVDSAVAHLAGALAAPIWVLVPYAADWRWLRHRDDNPWYPTMRLFRQPRPCDWDEPFGRLEAALAERTSTGA